MDTSALKTYVTALEVALSTARGEIASLTESDSTEFSTPSHIDPAKAVAANQVPEKINAVKNTYRDAVAALADELEKRYGVPKFPEDFPNATDYTFITNTIIGLRGVLSKI